MVGAAAWTVPLVVSTSQAQAAAGGKKCVANSVASRLGDGHIAACSTCGHIEDNPCGQSPSGLGCYCWVTYDGCCFCGANFFCNDVVCTKSNQCPPGYLCAYTCCSTSLTCVETCLHANTNPTAAPAAAGGRLASRG